MTNFRQPASALAIATAGLLCLSIGWNFTRPDPTALGAGFAPSQGAATGASPTRIERALPPQVHRLQPAVVPDGGQSEPVAALTLFVPYGWKTSGGIVWSPQYLCTDGLGVDWSARSPDGRAAIQMLPMARWEANNTGNPAPIKPGCVQQPFTDARAYLGAVVNHRWPGAHILDYRSRPDLAEVRQPVQRPAPGGGEVRIHGDAGQVLFAFRENGAEMRGLLTVPVVFTHTRLPVPGTMGQLQFMEAHANSVFAVTAPEGELDLAFYDALYASAQVNPKWKQLIEEHRGNMRRIELEGAAQRARIWQQHSAEMSRLITSSWQAGQRSGDQRAAQFSQYLRGVETYVDPRTGERRELASGQAAAWRLDDGSYLMSARAGFDPWRDLGVRAHALQPENPR